MLTAIIDPISIYEHSAVKKNIPVARRWTKPPYVATYM